MSNKASFFFQKKSVDGSVGDLGQRVKVKAYSFLHICNLDCHSAFFYGESLKRANMQMQFAGQTHNWDFSI